MLKPEGNSAGNSSMSDRYFIDTNVFVYTFDGSAPEKARRAVEIVEDALKTGGGLISTQVANEFLNVVLKKFKQPLSHTDAKEYLRTVLAPLCEVTIICERPRSIRR